MDCLEKTYKVGPGFLLSLTIAAIAAVLESLLPVHLIGASVIALFLGMLLNYFWRPVPTAQAGIRFTSKRILKLAIILLGTPLSIQAILHVGRYSLVMMCSTLLTYFGGGYFMGEALGLNWKLSNLISAGADICGGSAIAAIVPAVNVRDRDIAYAMSATFLFDVAMVLLFPIMGRAMGLSDMAYGLWSGTTVDGTPNVTAVRYAFSEAAGDSAIMVKLTRTLSITPTVIIFVLIEVRLRRRETAATSLNEDIRADIEFSSLFPWFILGFLTLAFINGLGFISPSLSLTLKKTSKFLIVASLGAIGLNTSFKEIYQSDTAPILHGFIISALVVIVAISVECFIGII